MVGVEQRGWKGALIATVLLALPMLGVHAWMAFTFHSYLHGQLAQGVVFTFALCALLVLVTRRRLLHVASIPVCVVVYMAWLFLVLGEGVSYYLQADTFNARFFANLGVGNLTTGLRAFPLMIGGGLAVLVVMLAACIAVLVWMVHAGRTARARRSVVIVALVVLIVVAVGVNSAPKRFVAYLSRSQQSIRLADTAQGAAVARWLNLDPVPKADIIAAPGKDVVWLYLESLERTYWDPKVFPGLTPNFDRLRKQGLDFSGFQTFAGATYTIAGMFASQCGMPLFTSPFAGLDTAAGNDNDRATFHAGLACFGDVLRKAGYRQVYMGGAPIAFSNKGMFYRLHGYNVALGLKQLEAQHGSHLPEEGWGLYDSVLFKLALKRYQKLERRGKPFNLTMITLDTHPPAGRPSPGCPAYRRNANSMLQAVHCTDYLVGKFVHALQQQRDWKNTIVVIMSDHLMMRNDAESLYPEGYHRQPALLVLNAGQGVRPARMYHMDVAPTLLHLMGVRTNATFIAGADRSSPTAPPSKLVNNATDVAVLRKALWMRAKPLQVCQNDTLLARTGSGQFEMGGRVLPLSHLGVRVTGIQGGQALDFFVGGGNAKLLVADAGKQQRLLAARGKANVLSIELLPRDARGANLFTVDWLTRGGARAHLADIPRLGGLTVTSPRCGAALARVDAAPTGKSFDLAHDFHATTTPPPMVRLSKDVDFRKPEALTFERGYGWLPPMPWGSWSIGDEAMLAFRLPRTLCHAAVLRLRLNPYLPPSRPNLDVAVRVNGKLATTWHFKAPASTDRHLANGKDDPEVLRVDAPIAADRTCVARVDFKFTRPGATAPPYPRGEDGRALMFALGKMRVVAAGTPH